MPDWKERAVVAERVVLDASDRLNRLETAIRPLARALDDFEAQFTAEELAALDYDTHLIGGGISLADCRRAKALLNA